MTDWWNGRGLPVVAGLVMAVLMVSAARAGERKVLAIGSGEVTGYYYPVAGALCRVMNKEHVKPGLCLVMPSSGSAANVAALKAGEIDMAILQARAAQQAVAGGEGFKENGPFPDMRAVMSLHGEAVLLLAREGAEINSVADLKGKRVNLGRPGSFQRFMAGAVLEAAGLSEGELSPAVELDLSEQAGELCEGNIDAAFFSGIHPMPEAVTALGECNATIVPIKAKTMDGFLKRNPWAGHGTIRKGTYDGQDADIPSLEMETLLVTTTQVPAEDVQAVLRAVNANFTAMTRLHPVLGGLQKAASAKDGMAIKLHEGAEKFYGEAQQK